jgi:hypothetical protein
MIVSDGYLLGDRVSRYRLGRVIPQRDVDATLVAIRETVLNKDCSGFESGASEYLEVHSTARLKQAMDEMLSSIWGADYRQR